ncbi:MAG: GHKL domain-containing protein [Clostridia bacterium]|nr:GHKL domain-containing protein [Clostridia bacterium]
MTDFLWDLVNICVCFYEAFILFMILKFCVGYDVKRRKDAVFGWPCIALLSTLFYLFSLSGTFIFTAVLMTAEILYAMFCFDRSVNMRYLFGFCARIFSVTARTLSMLFLHITGYGVTGESGIYTVWIYVILLTLFFFITVGIRTQDLIITPKLMYTTFGIMQVSLCSVTAILSYAQSKADVLHSVSPFLYMSLAMLSVSVVSLFLSYKIASVNKKYVDERMVARRHEDELQHYEQMGAMLQALRTNKHDFNLHLRTILGMSKNSDEICEYVEQLLSEPAQVQMRINTGNVSLDALISEHMMRADTAGISFSSKLFIPERLPMPVTEFCSILGNLLDNALEASKKITDKAYIRLSVTPENDMLRIYVENSSDGNYKKLHERLLTTKKDSLEHGLGLARINFLVRKYGGACHFNPCSDRFEANIFLPLSEEETC